MSGDRPANDSGAGRVSDNNNVNFDCLHTLLPGGAEKDSAFQQQDTASSHLSDPKKVMDEGQCSKGDKSFDFVAALNRVADPGKNDIQNRALDKALKYA